VIGPLPVAESKTADLLGSIPGGGGETPPVTQRASYRAVGVAMAVAGVVCFSFRPT